MSSQNSLDTWNVSITATKYHYTYCCLGDFKLINSFYRQNVLYLYKIVRFKMREIGKVKFKRNGCWNCVYIYKYCPVFFVNIDTHLQSSNYSKKYYDKRDIFENIRFLLLRALLFTKYMLSIFFFCNCGKTNSNYSS